MDIPDISLNPKTISRINTKEVQTSPNCQQWIAIALAIVAIALFAFAFITLAARIAFPAAVILLTAGSGLGLIGALFYNYKRTKSIIASIPLKNTRISHYLVHSSPGGSNSSWGNSTPVHVPSSNRGGHNNAPQQNSSWGNSTPVHVPSSNRGGHNNAPQQNSSWGNSTPVHVPSSNRGGHNNAPQQNSSWGNSTPVHVPSNLNQPQPGPGIETRGNSSSPGNNSSNTPYSNNSGWGKNKK